ncbi:unnamed protein product [Lupinus luteus]|uniref:Protein FAR1-RELATED SEQUENCE n=1 Tax=Lupinus luteus TaxID=3873 RepID=A0AAV1WIL5_LUPLU
MEETPLCCEQLLDGACIEVQKEEDGSLIELHCQNGFSEGGREFVAPAIGMEFESYDDAYNYYICYAKERWRILEVTLDHNHVLGAKICKSVKRMGTGTKRKSLPRPDAEVQTIKLYRALVVDARVVIFLVKERILSEGNKREIRDYEVLYSRTAGEVRCICSCFNFYGYLCRHALCVLNFNGAEEIPSKYILPRWKKDYKRLYIPGHSSGDANDTDRIQWCHQLFRSALKVVEEGIISLDHYNVALQAFQESLGKVHDVEQRQE